VTPLTVATFDDNLEGTYVLQAQGVDNSGQSSYQFAGVVVLDGQGNITSGEQTVNFYDQTLATPALVSKTDAVTGGSYYLGGDGRGTITIVTGDNDIGQGIDGLESFAFVYLSKSQSLVSQMDFGLVNGNAPNTGASATGTMDLQATPVPTLAPGGYAFVASGLGAIKMKSGTQTSAPMAFGGILNIDSSNNVTGVTDEILAKNANASDAALSGTVTPIPNDRFGTVAFTLQAPFGLRQEQVTIDLTGYVVDDTHIKLIESDNTSGAGFGSTAGIAIGQGTATGTFTNASLDGSYVFGVLGVDLSPNNSGYLPATLTSVGVFSADGSGNLDNDTSNSGYTDTFLLYNSAQGTSGAKISAPFTGTYSVDASGTGRATLTINQISLKPNPSYQPAFLAYLTGNGNPALVLERGNGDYPFLGAGIAYPQSTTLTFSGDYGFSFTQLSSSGENDATAQMMAASASLSGFADGSLNATNPLDPTLADHDFSGGFASPQSNGIFNGTFSNTIVEKNAPPIVGTAFTVGSNTNNQFAADYYIVDPSRGFFVETDLVNSALPSGQVSFGYYAARTPLCASCP
jgi:hypothetical protein